MIRTLPTTEAAAQLAAWWSVVELCLPSHRDCRASTFRPAGAETLRTDWDVWLETIFRPSIEPALDSLAVAAGAGNSAGVLAADAALGRSLPAEERAASLRAGREVLLDYAPPQGARLLERLRAAARDDRESGHLATVFAARGQAFHLPAVQLRAAFLLAECVTGSAAAGVTLRTEAAVEMMQAALPGGSSRPARQPVAV